MQQKLKNARYRYINARSWSTCVAIAVFVILVD